MPSLIESIIENLKLICLNYCTLGKVNSAPRWQEVDDTTFSFNKDAIQLLDRTIDKIRAERPQIEQNFSAKYLAKELDRILFLCKLKPVENIDSILRSEVVSLISRLQSTVESWVFFIPIINFKFENIKKIRLGNVIFYDLNLKTLKYLMSKFRFKFGFLESSTKAYATFKEQEITAFAVVKVEAGEDNKASTKALQQVERSLNVLRLYSFNNQFGTQRESLISKSYEDITYKNLTNDHYGTSSRTISTFQFYPFTINKSQVSSMRKKGNFRGFNKLLTLPSPTELQSKILTSLHWYGLAVKDERDIDKFVKLVISLESLLLNKTDQPKKHLLADRSAFILAKKKNSRKEIFDLVTNAYSIRGDIVHEGRYEISQEETYKVLNLVRKLIFKLLKLSNSISELKQIKDKIKEIKFGSPISIS